MGVLRACLGPAVHLVREAGVRSEMLTIGGQGPLVAFLPAYGRHGAALLRIYAIADALKPLGWRTLVLPWRLTLAQRHRILARMRPDVLVMQGARHALNRPALYGGCPILYDLDDADFHLPHLADAVRRAMPQVAGVLAGSRYIADWCRAAGAAQVHLAWTGAPPSARARSPHRDRPAVIAWGQTRPMTYTREAGWVRRFTQRLAGRHPGLVLRLFDRQPGDDPGFAASFAARGMTVEWVRAVPYDAYLRRLDDVSLGLAPLAMETPFSRGKSFGKVLAYLDRHVPVIAADEGEHPHFFTASSGVVSNDPAVWEDRAAGLLADPSARQRMAGTAHAAFLARLSTHAAAVRVAESLTAVMRDPARRAG